MTSSVRLVALGAAAFVAFLVTTAPATLLLRSLEAFGVEARGVSGTVWRGTASDLRLRELELGRLTWDLHVLRLLSGRASATLSLDHGEGFLEGEVAATLGGRIRVTDLAASWPLASLRAAGVQNGWTGTANVRLAALELDNGMPVSMTGTIEAIDVAGPANRPLDVGSYRATFPDAAAPPDDSITGTIEDLEGPLDVDGTLRVGPGRSYLAEGTVLARPDAPPQVANALQYLGEPDSEGRRPFALEGTY